MNKRPLGSNGPLVSEIGLGTWSFAGSYGPTDEAESHATLKTCLDLGIDFLDTANVYGMGISESVIASFMQNNPGEFTIATKGGIARDPETNRRYFRNDYDYLAEQLDKSLKRLNVDHVPLYYVHKREEDRDIEEVMDGMARLQKSGKIGHIGLCEVSPATLRRAHAVAPVAAVQSEYSLWTRYPDLGVIQTCKDLGIAFVPFSPLGRGIFASNAPDPSTFVKGDFRIGTTRFSEPAYAYNLKQVEGFKRLAAEMGTTAPTLAIAWCLGRGEHLLPIPGTRSSEHLIECANASDLKLTESDMAAIEQVLPVGWAWGDRYMPAQQPGAERYC
ncbi:MAG: aldo/keto reductase [Pseudomonadota bacterium]